MARLATGFWVSAYLMRLQAAGIFSHVAARGDEQAGAVAVKVATMDRRASLFLRRYDTDFTLIWTAVLTDAAEMVVEEELQRQRGYDRDLWVIEVEDPRGRHLLEEDGLA